MTNFGKPWIQGLHNCQFLIRWKLLWLIIIMIILIDNTLVIFLNIISNLIITGLFMVLLHIFSVLRHRLFDVQLILILWQLRLNLFGKHTNFDTFHWIHFKLFLFLKIVKVRVVIVVVFHEVIALIRWLLRFQSRRFWD